MLRNPIRQFRSYWLRNKELCQAGDTLRWFWCVEKSLISAGVTKYLKTSPKNFIRTFSANSQDSSGGDGGAEEAPMKFPKFDPYKVKRVSCRPKKAEEQIQVDECGVPESIKEMASDCQMPKECDPSPPKLRDVPEKPKNIEKTVMASDCQIPKEPKCDPSPPKPRDVPENIKNTEKAASDCAEKPKKCDVSPPKPKDGYEAEPTAPSPPKPKSSKKKKKLKCKAVTQPKPPAPKKSKSKKTSGCKKPKLKCPTESCPKSKIKFECKAGKYIITIPIPKCIPCPKKKPKKPKKNDC